MGRPYRNHDGRAYFSNDRQPQTQEIGTFSASPVSCDRVIWDQPESLLAWAMEWNRKRSCAWMAKDDNPTRKKIQKQPTAASHAVVCLVAMCCDVLYRTIIDQWLVSCRFDWYVHGPPIGQSVCLECKHGKKSKSVCRAFRIWLISMGLRTIQKSSTWSKTRYVTSKGGWINRLRIFFFWSGRKKPFISESL